MKKHHTLIALVLLLPFFSYSQRILSIGANANTQTSFMATESYPLYKSGLGIGYTLGLQMQFQFGESVFLRSGLQYQKRNNLATTSVLIETSLSTLQGDRKQKFLATSVSIPIEFGYYIVPDNSKIRYLLGLGGILHQRIKSSIYTVTYAIDSGSIENKDTVSKAEFSKYSLGIFSGIEMALNKKLMWSLEANLRYTPNRFKIGRNGPKAETIGELGFTLRVRMR